MELEKNNYINSLFEFYQSLLTDKQKSYLELYYADDYSLGEIAEEFSISRQAVYDNIRRSEKLLQQYEDKLGLYRLYQARNQKLDQISMYVAENYANDQQLIKMIKNLEVTEEE
ncbi:putative DNA-binding protein [Lentilactobacillus laojiaonis]|uniref:putative DNA-binding protein n=1 Tax=Lentilactobacillus laojiaonis TaxID=2883998 RepID=UPI001D0B3836|nr:putative DNA-binding protein [Lentilactobacillus laojiaonis]UDM32663.1 putative DNA-binding protein [Lentilactobacillus laojiaonis]